MTYHSEPIPAEVALAYGQGNDHTLVEDFIIEEEFDALHKRINHLMWLLAFSIGSQFAAYLAVLAVVFMP